MGLTVGFATRFFQIDLIISAIHDNFWMKLNKYLKSREILSLFVVSFGFILCIPFLSRASLMLLSVAEIHLAIQGPVWLIILETIFILGSYGWGNVLRNIKEMT